MTIERSPSSPRNKAREEGQLISIVRIVYWNLRRTMIFHTIHPHCDGDKQGGGAENDPPLYGWRDDLGRENAAYDDLYRISGDHSPGQQSANLSACLLTALLQTTCQRTRIGRESVEEGRS